MKRARTEPSVLSFFFSLILAIFFILTLPFWFGTVYSPDDIETLTLHASFASYDPAYSLGEPMIAAGVFQIDIAIQPVADSVPTRTRLMIGDILLEQKMTLQNPVFNYHNDSGFEPNLLQFIYNRGALDDISELLSSATLLVDEAIICTDEIDCTVTSSIDTIELISSSPASP